MSEDKLVIKIILSLPKRFNMKITAIKEAQDVSTMKFDEFFDSLLISKMTIDDKFEKKSKKVMFQVNIVNHED